MSSKKTQSADSPYSGDFFVKENLFRKRVLKEFSKTREDFATLKEYNDYLETIEQLVFNLVTNSNLEETNKIMEENRKLNKNQIAGRMARNAAEEFSKKSALQQQEQQTQQAAAPVPSTTSTTQPQQKSNVFDPTKNPAVASSMIAKAMPKKGAAPPLLSKTTDPEVLKKRARAGGYSMDVPLRRALDEIQYVL